MNKKPPREFIGQFGLNTGWLVTCAEYIGYYCRIAENLYPKELVQNIIKYDGSKNSEDTSSPYGALLTALTDELGHSGNGTNYEWRECRSFLQWAVHDIHDRTIAALTARKRDRLKQLERERATIESEVAELLTPKAESTRTD